MEELFTFQNFIALLTLTALEIVLGIDNIVFIAILSGRLPEEQRNRARRLGLAGAMVIRIVLLLGISFVMGLKDTLFNAFGQDVSGKDLILIIGGAFLIAKATHEIHAKLEGSDESGGPRKAAATMGGVIIQIMLMDIIFSLDSVVTAVGMAQHLWVMISAVVIAVGVMMLFARPVSDFVERHPTVKMLALSFLILIGVTLVAEGIEHEIHKGYIYFAMAFSLAVEMLNLKVRKKAEPVALHEPHMPMQERRKSSGP
ncbi:MAG TPA: TerC family protein [Phycisphaerales bacterium]|nr:TerC family protein [Phycisphaerales bacterium]